MEQGGGLFPTLLPGLFPPREPGSSLDSNLSDLPGPSFQRTLPLGLLWVSAAAQALIASKRRREFSKTMQVVGNRAGVHNHPDLNSNSIPLTPTGSLNLSFLVSEVGIISTLQGCIKDSVRKWYGFPSARVSIEVEFGLWT